MTWANRFKLFFGFIVVVAIVAVCTVIFNQRQSSAQSESAEMVAQQYQVGTDYGGLVVKQYVQEDDQVEEGDPLFEIRSPQRRKDAEEGTLLDSDSIADAQKGIVMIRANVSGTVAEISAPQGAYAVTSMPLTHLDKAGTLAIDAKFVLTPRDYGRVSAGAEAQILLPNNTTITGTVTHIDVATVDGKAASTIRIDSPALARQTALGIFQPGTPVSVSLRLRDDGPLSGVSDALHDFLRKIGL